jgi:NAD(P)-dependent dehydrogenase (short-subunit alcohol dehydrogenase family)
MDKKAKCQWTENCSGHWRKRGIGKAIVYALPGWAPLVVNYAGDAAETTASTARRAARRACQFDVADAEVQAALKKILADFGRVDILSTWDNP